LIKKENKKIQEKNFFPNKNKFPKSKKILSSKKMELDPTKDFLQVNTVYEHKCLDSNDSARPLFHPINGNKYFTRIGQQQQQIDALVIDLMEQHTCLGFKQLV